MPMLFNCRTFVTEHLRITKHNDATWLFELPQYPCRNIDTCIQWQLRSFFQRIKLIYKYFTVYIWIEMDYDCARRNLLQSMAL